MLLKLYHLSLPASSTQLLDGTTLKALKAGTNITLTNDATSVTINGPVVSGFQNTLTAATASGAHPILNGTTIKCLKQGTGITMLSDGTSVTINSIDAYTKTEVTNSLNLKANAASPVFSGNLILSKSDPTGGNVAMSATNTGSNGFASLYLQTSNQISPTINETAQIFVGQNVGMFLHTRTNHPICFQTYSDQPSTTVTPSMKILSTGTRDVEIYTPLKIKNTNTTFDGGTQNITFNNNGGTPSTLKAILDLKADLSNVYTRTDAATVFQMKIDTFADPLKFVVGALNSTLSIDPASALTINQATITNSLTAGSLTVNSNLTVNGYISAKPYVSLRIVTTGGTQSTGTTSGTIGTPGTATVTNLGYTSPITTSRGNAGATNAFLYTFTWTTPHPLGANYAIMCNFYGTSTANLSPNAFFRTSGTSTAISVWIRTSDGIIKDENFYVYTVP